MIPKVSLIYAARREGENVKKTIDSLIENTTDPEWEAIIVADGHEDTCCDFLLQTPYWYDERLTLVRLREPRGCATARHIGATLATGEVLVFGDAHLRYYSGWLPEFVKVLESFGPGAIVESAYDGIDEDWNLTEVYQTSVYKMKPTMGFDFESAADTGLLAALNGGCVAIDRDWYSVLGGLDTGMRVWGSEFIELAIRNYAFGGMCYLAPSVRVGHLFRKTLPSKPTWADVHYNRLRTAYVHFDPFVFAQVLCANSTEDGFSEGIEAFLTDRESLEQRRLWVNQRRMRPAEWYQDQFLDWAPKQRG